MNNFIEPTIITTQSDEIVVTTKTEFAKFCLGYDGRQFRVGRITDEYGIFDRWALLNQLSQTMPLSELTYIHERHIDGFVALYALLIKVYDDFYQYLTDTCLGDCIIDTEETILEAMQDGDEDGFFAAKLARLREATA